RNITEKTKRRKKRVPAPSHTKTKPPWGDSSRRTSLCSRILGHFIGRQSPFSRSRLAEHPLPPPPSLRTAN
ncbi:hypothetical protein QQP08_023370, partial [Theobroma cacao]